MLDKDQGNLFTGNVAQLSINFLISYNENMKQAMISMQGMAEKGLGLVLYKCVLLKHFLFLKWGMGQLFYHLK